jgi:hypothetical protein
MPGAINSLDIHSLEDSLIEVTWIQWRTLGTLIDSDRIGRAMIDPEALLLISLTLRHRERRLWDVLASWAMNGSQLFSLQRVKNLLSMYPAVTMERLAEFAHRAEADGNDFRWRSLAGADSGPAARNQDLWSAYPRVWHLTAMILRLRLGIGMGVAPDLLSFLLSLRGQWVSAAQIAQAINYSVYAIRRVADDMAAAQLIESTRVKPLQYRAKVEAWLELLGIGGEYPEWRYWHPVYSLAAKIIVEYESGEWDVDSPYLLSTKLRDLVEEHRDAFISNHIDYPDPRKFTGEAYIPAFSASLEYLAKWIKEVV